LSRNKKITQAGLDFEFTAEDRKLFPIYIPDTAGTYRQAKRDADMMFSFGFIATVYRKKRFKHKRYYIIIEIDENRFS